MSGDEFERARAELERERDAAIERLQSRFDALVEAIRDRRETLAAIPDMPEMLRHAPIALATTLELRCHSHNTPQCLAVQVNYGWTQFNLGNNEETRLPPGKYRFVAFALPVVESKA